MDTLSSQIAPHSEKGRLSESTLWDYQKAFYSELGTDAWSDKIPFFATNNSFMAEAYANIICHFIQNWEEASPSNEPFYILEIGAGTGMLGFHMLNALKSRKDQLKEHSYVYVLSDFVEHNIDFWKSHPAFNEFIDEGTLGFARYDVGKSQELEIEIPGQNTTKKLSIQSRSKKPLMVIANYLFDSLPTDVFSIQNNQLFEAHTRKKIKPNRNELMNTGGAMTQVGLDFSYVPAEKPYYNDQDYDKVISSYMDLVSDGHFLFPNSAMDCLKSLKTLSGNQLLVLATDKGFGVDEHLHMIHEPDIILHNNAFSLSVNFNAIGRFAIMDDGDCYHQNTQGQVNTSVFSLGFDFSTIDGFKETLKSNVNSRSVSNLLNVYDVFENTKVSCSQNQLLSYLSLLNWEPYIVNLYLEFLSFAENQLHPIHIATLERGITESLTKFYHIPNGPMLHYNIGFFYQTMQLYEQALDFYLQSIALDGINHSSAYNIALCHFFLENQQEALKYFKEALQLDYPNPILIKGWITQINEELEMKKASTSM